MSEVNRWLNDKDMDHIDHALGRPCDPMGETYRDYFVANPDTATALDMEASPHWTSGAASHGGVVFHVTYAGRAALAAHLKQIADPHRRFTVTFDGHGMSVVGTSHSNAKYELWLDLSDCNPDLRFIAFAREATVRLAQ